MTLQTTPTIRLETEASDQSFFNDIATTVEVVGGTPTADELAACTVVLAAAATARSKRC